MQKDQEDYFHWRGKSETMFFTKITGRLHRTIRCMVEHNIWSRNKFEPDAKLGRELVTVLENGLELINLCDQKDSPALVLTILGCKGQLSEIIDDARIYVQMINHLIGRILKSSPDAGKQVSIETLMLQVESDCKSLQSSLQIACEEDKEILIHSAKFQSGSKWFFQFRSDSQVSSMLLMLKTTEPNINDADLPMKKELGEGGFGTVHSALWHKLPVAVKTFKSDAYLENELNVYRMMLLHSSSHIVHILGHTRENKLVLELMEKDLGKHIMARNSPLPLIQSIDLMLQIAKPMKYLHSIDLVHRDLKPSNVLVNVRKDRRLLIKLVDFGISRENFETASNTDMKGTIMYMAPEMLEGRKDYSRKVDVYSFGLVCAEILTWRMRAPKTLPEMLELTRKGDPAPLPKDIPKKLESLIQSCVKYNDNERPSFQEICHDLWLLKEEALNREVSTRAIELILTIDGLEGIRVEKIAIGSAIHPFSTNSDNSNSKLEVSHNDLLPAQIVASHIVHPSVAPYSTTTSKRAVYIFDRESNAVSRGDYSVKDIPINVLSEIRLDGFLDIEPSGGDYSVKDIPINVLSEIRLDGFLDIEPSGKVQIRDPWSALQNPFIGIGVDPQNRRNEKHSPEDLGIFGQFKKLLRDQGKKFNLYLQIGGWGHSKYFSAAFSSPTTRTTFVDSLVELVTKYPIFNGLAIDWQHISNNGKNYGKLGNMVNVNDVDNLVLALEALRTKLPSTSFMIFLTCSPYPGQQWPIEKIIHLVDQIHITRPFVTKDIASHRSSLYASSFSKFSIDEAVKMYMSHGIPSSKILIEGSLIGGGYGDTNGMGMPASDTDNVAYNRLPASLEKWDDEAKAAYSHDPINRVVYSYDNVQSIVEKTKYVKENDLGGIVVWHGQSDFPPDHQRSVMKALRDHLIHS